MPAEPLALLRAATAHVQAEAGGADRQVVGSQIQLAQIFQATVAGWQAAQQAQRQVMHTRRGDLATPSAQTIKCAVGVADEMLDMVHRWHGSNLELDHQVNGASRHHS